MELSSSSVLILVDSTDRRSLVARGGLGPGRSRGWEACLPGARPGRRRRRCSWSAGGRAVAGRDARAARHLPHGPSRGATVEAPRRQRSRSRSRRPPGWSGCGSGWPARRAASAAGCSPCSAASSSTRTPGSRSRTPCSPPTSGSAPTQQVVDGLRTRLRVEGAPRGPEDRAPRGARHARRPDHGPPAPGQRGRRQAGRRPRGRRQRLRQDHHGRQARPDPGRRGPHRDARRRRHVPRRRGRPARHLGRAGGRRGGPRRRGHRPGERRVRGGAARRRAAASTP